MFAPVEPVLQILQVNSVGFLPHMGRDRDLEKDRIMRMVCLRTVDSEGARGDKFERKNYFVLFCFVVRQKHVEVKLELPPLNIKLKQTILELDVSRIREL